ncbi:MAG: dual CXXC motif small (seleno)protein [Desulfovibrio aminophilus]|uniref:dual CXXC motif small (seleno)protein n=1 Tax=Desulfovibrio aminophilus TaxID=81425 RepID=UPI0039EBB437
MDTQGRSSLTCPACRGRLHPVRGCREVALVCADCGAKYPVRRFAAFLDDAFEEEVALVPLDRL